MPLYKYEILDLDSGGRKTQSIKYLFAKAIQTRNFLKDNLYNFATNNVKTLISWKDLAKDILDSSEKVEDGVVKKNISVGTNPVPARFKIVGEVKVDDLINHSNAEMANESKDISEVIRCLNILICKNLGLDVHRNANSPNKLFVRNARRSLTSRINILSQSLELIRGYYFTIKPGMGNLLLNFNLAASAFLKPFLVSEFINDMTTFNESEQREKALIGKPAYIVPERGSIGDTDYNRLNSTETRIKAIAGFGGKIEELTFQKRILGADGKFKRDENGSYFFGGRIQQCVITS